MAYTDDSCQNIIDKKFLTLNVTEQCNLQCMYCYQKDRRERKKGVISFDVATAAIEAHLTRDDEFTKVIIELIGGEAFLYFPLIRSLIEWTYANRSRWRKNFLFFIDTNGTLIKEHMKPWFYERRDYVVIGLSLDGTPEAHDLNRSNSYSRIAPHIPFIAETWPNQPVKMTISPRTIPMLFESIIHIMRLGLPVAANVPMENIWGSPAEKAKHVTEFREQLEKLVHFFGNNPEVPLPTAIDLPIGVIRSKEHNRPWCGSGRNMVAIETDGTILPCNRYAKMSFDQSLFDLPRTSKNSRCEYCMFKPACQSCEALNWEINGDPQARTTFHCDFSKLQILATAQVHSLRVQKHLNQLRKMPMVEIGLYDRELQSMEDELVITESILAEFDKHDCLMDVGMMAAKPLCDGGVAAFAA